MQKQVQYIIKGMNRDMTVSKFPADHSFENKNIRITQREGQTLLSITNEKGPEEFLMTWDSRVIYANNTTLSGSCVINGKILGHCVIRQYLVLFVRRDDHTMVGNRAQFTDSIYRIDIETGTVVVLLQTVSYEDLSMVNEVFTSGLNFGDNVQALGLYENDNIIKVYFVDGRNQNRVINIVDPIRLKDNGNNTFTNSFTANDLNFIPLQSFGEDISIERVDSSNGVFAPGTIQYALTYHNMYGQETSIFYQSDLYYTSFADRGGSEEETVSNAFKITLDNLDTSFDYVRIYSILRTSINAAPQCNIVADLKVEDRVLTFVDNGTVGEAYDYNALLYMNGEAFSSKTIAEKDSTLFAGNLNLLVPKIPDNIKKFLRDATDTIEHPWDNSGEVDTSQIQIHFVSTKGYDIGEPAGYYPYNIHLDKNKGKITTFKYLETYRFGIQFLHKTGKWSEVVFLGDAKNTTAPSTSMSTTTLLVKANIELNLQSDFSNYFTWFSNNGFVKMRAVVVYPELWDRSVLAQGIICPTVYNVEDRRSNRPFAYSSWYSRPNSGGNSLTNTLGNPEGTYNEFRHNKQIPRQLDINAEIQCITDKDQSPIFTQADYPIITDEKIDNWVQEHKENFFIDKSIVTFHSPEIEMSTDLDVLDLSDVSMRIIGIVPLTSFDSDIYLSTSTIGNFSLNKKLSQGDDGDIDRITLTGPGFYDQKTKVTNLSVNGWRERMGNINWIDEESHYKLGSNHANEEHEGNPPRWYGFFVYPWHRSKSLNNTTKPDENGWESALLENKIITNSRYSFNSFFLEENSIWTPDNGVSGVKLANIEPQSEESEVSLIKIPEPQNSNLGELNYYGSVDKIVVPSNKGIKAEGYPIVISAASRLTEANDESGSHQTRSKTLYEIYTGKYNQSSSASDIAAREAFCAQGTLVEYLPIGASKSLYSNDKDYWNHSPYVSVMERYISNPGIRKSYWNVTTFDPVRIRFKSTKHAVMAFNYLNIGTELSPVYNQVILPRFTSESAEDTFASTDKYYWEALNTNKAEGISQTSLPDTTLSASGGFGYLFLGELYREDSSIQNRFGGTTEEALEQNTWIPAGDMQNIAATTLVADRGDTFYQRYDCLKTYPFTPDEKNSLIETVSFMCETRINCDGRYDKNRGNATKFTITPKNFNLMNSAYNQRNNFFNYHALNSNRTYPDHFNQVTWSMTKSLGEEIDTWAKINLGSLMDMDGEYGEIVALVFFGNEVWCFQEKGISKILFNSRVQIPVSDGVPIEITNGMKVQGKIYLTTKAGLQNKFAITATPNGVYFMDGYNHTISIFNGQNIQNISDIKGFREWMYQQDAITEWKNNPARGQEDSYKVFYDSAHQDVYFVNGSQCLVFSELLAEFTSFYDYNYTSVMDTVHDNFYAATDFDETVNNATEPRIRLWKMFDGEYNMFYKPADVPDEIQSVDLEEEPTYPWMDYYRPFYVIYNVNPDPTLDKTFDNIEFRSDSWDNYSLVTGTESAGVNKTFDLLEAATEYQYGALPLSFSHAQHSGDSTLKRKFRVWRTIMPRQQGTRNRIRNTWCQIKLSWQNPNRFKTVLHDVVVKYFV